MHPNCTYYLLPIKGGGTSILSNEFVVIGSASTDNLGVLLGLHAKCGPCGHRWEKVAQKTRKIGYHTPLKASVNLKRLTS